MWLSGVTEARISFPVSAVLCNVTFVLLMFTTWLPMAARATCFLVPSQQEEENFLP